MEKQSTPDGDFPTVVSPNPEESAALEMAINQAKDIGASLVMATDPDADRVGIAVKDYTGEFILVNGNQTACLLTYYLIKKWKENNKLTGKEFIDKKAIKDFLDTLHYRYTFLISKPSVRQFHFLTIFAPTNRCPFNTHSISLNGKTVN